MKTILCAIAASMLISSCSGIKYLPSVSITGSSFSDIAPSLTIRAIQIEQASGK